MPEQAPENMDWPLSPYTGEFIHPEAERRFFEDQVQHIAGYLRLVLPILGVLYLAFAIPDWFVLESRTTFLLLLFFRILFLVFMILTGMRINAVRSYRVYQISITLAEVLSVFLFILSFALYDSADFMIQSFGLMIILAAFYLVPNRFVNRMLVSLMTIGVYLNIAWMTLDSIRPMNILAVAVYLILTIVISSVAAVRTDTHKRRQYIDNMRLQHQVVTDPLTGLFNRQKFDNELDLQLRRSGRSGAPLTLVILDIDNFKQINDCYGHYYGDLVLVELARRLKNIVRGTDVLARWGGEEFVLLLPATTLGQGVELSERLRTAVSSISVERTLSPASDRFTIAAPEVYGGSDSISITCSFGVSINQTNDTPISIVQRADAMLYAAKNAGRNCVVAEPSSSGTATDNCDGPQPERAQAQVGLEMGASDRSNDAAT